MKKIKVFLLVVLIFVIFTVSGSAKDYTFETSGGFIQEEGGGNLLLGGKVSFGSGIKTSSLKLIGFGVTDTSSLFWPAKYQLSYDTGNLYFVPALGFVKSDLELFLQRSRQDKTFALGGTIDVFASMLTTAIQMRVMRLPTGYYSDGFKRATSVLDSDTLATDEPFLSLVNTGDGLSSYVSVLHKLHPDYSLRVSYLGNFNNNKVNSLWANWEKTEIAYGSLSLGLGVENGEAGFLPKGAFGVLNYTAPITSLYAMEGSLRFGSVAFGDTVTIDPHLAAHLKLLFDDGDNEVVFVTGFETVTGNGWLGEKEPGYGAFKFILRYTHKEDWPLSVYITKDNAKHFGVGVNYQF